MSVLAVDWGTGEVFWSLLWFFMFFIWIWLLIGVIGDIFRSHDLSGVAKAAWVIAIIIVPYLGVFLYLIIRGGKMHEHALQAHEQRDAALRTYIQGAAGTSGGSTADELEKLARLREQGAIDDEEYATAKSRALA